MTPRTFAPKAAVVSASFFKARKERTRTPDAFASEHSNVVAGRVLMGHVDSLANRLQLTVRCSIAGIAITSRINLLLHGNNNT